MPLSRQDLVQLAAEVERLLRNHDPGVLELILRGTEKPDDPGWYLVELLRKTRQVYSERSGGMHSKILDRLNHFVRQKDGSPIRGLSVLLSPAEQERYQTDEVSLAELPDRSEFLLELDRIIANLIRDIESTTGAAVTRDEVQRQLRDVFRRHLGVPSIVAKQLVPGTVTEGKLYEAHVLSRVVERLVQDEGYSLALVGGPKVQLKSSPGPINRHYPRIELRRYGNLLAELWTDIEFLSLSYCRTRKSAVTRGDYHELDIVIVDPEFNGRPPCSAVWLGIECKNTGYGKGLLKEILGIRRELSLLTEPQRTRFRVWPRASIPADPASCLLVYSTDANVTEYSSPGATFGIDFVHEAM